jgi:hypothetical protein
MSPSEMIDKYIKLRNVINKIKDDHKTQLEPYTNVMNQLETEILRHLDDTNLQSISSPSGTAFKQIATSVVVKDWPQTLGYIQQYELWDLLEARVSKTAALEVVEETKKPIPGVQISQAVVVRVRVSS